ncbi:MAG: MurR/RpiR family transcriptional regulator [Acidobacteriota bacterium]|nr:MurR/RpiR family transcriptional regulator [Acidobacteriota bacterium]
MPRISSQEEFRELVLKNLTKLPPQQQLIAEYLMGHIDEVPFISVPRLAELARVSEATVVRFAQRIGFDGFSAMKAALTEMVRGQVSSRGSDVTLPGDDQETLELVIHQETGNIHRLANEIEPEALSEAAGAVFAARHTYIFGLGISSILADLSAYLFTQIGLRATVLTTRFSSPLEQLVVLQPKDMLMVFSYPPFSAQTIEMVKDAHSRSITTLAVTDRLTAPIAPYADHLFRVRSTNSMFTNALGAATVFLNALITEIATLHGEHASRAVGRINRILTEDDNLLS